MPMDGHLSGPLIARGLVAALPAMIACATIAEHGLALGKDFAVSLPLCCPYGGIGPSSSGWGPPRRFQHGRHCSHLYSCERRPLAATFLSGRATLARYADGECPDFPLRGIAFEGSATTATVWMTSIGIISHRPMIDNCAGRRQGRCGPFFY